MVQNRMELIPAKELSMVVDKLIPEGLMLLGDNMLDIGLVGCLQTSVIDKL